MSTSSSANSHSPCAACKFLRRKCTQECVFSPYFPPENPKKFEAVHRVFGASNVAKILQGLPVAEREVAAFSLAYEAEARYQDPVYGCLSTLTYFKDQLAQLRFRTSCAKRDLAKCYGPEVAAMKLQPLVLEQERKSHANLWMPYQQQQIIEYFPENGSYGNQVLHQGPVSGTVVEYHQTQLPHNSMLGGDLADANSDIVPYRNG